MPRREKWGIAGAILQALEVESAKGSHARLTNVAARANIAYDRLQEYITDLEAQGLLQPAGRVPRLSERGRDFLREYRSWTEILSRFGFAEPSRSIERVRQPQVAPLFEDA